MRERTIEVNTLFLNIFNIAFTVSSVDMPLLPADGPITINTTGSLTQQEEVEPRLLELEQDPANWRDLASSEVLSKLTKKETKRQEIINGKWMCILS